MSSELSTGRTIFILAVVVGCFAVLWPKVFYPMLTASIKHSGSGTVPLWRDPLNAHHLTQLCYLLEQQPGGAADEFTRWSDEDCVAFIKKSCGVVLTERILDNFRLSKDKSNLTECLRQRYEITVQKVLAAAPPSIRVKPHMPQSPIHPHARPERPSHLHPENLHPALREKGRTMPQRTIEKQARPGPMPGVRPTIGGGGHMVPPQSKGSGAMGIIMPLYTVGIVIFFVYTIMKVLFKKNADEDCKAPKLKDFHLDPEYRKYVFAEEYLDSSNASHRDLLRRHERETSKQRRRQDSTSQPDTKIEDEQMDQLRRRLEETERAMERLMSQMGSVTDKLTAAKITEVLSQAQAQARILKEAAEGASDDDFTTSEAFTNTLSEDFSLPLALQRHLEELKVKDMYLKGTSAGIFAPPPISPDEVASLSDEDASEHGPKAVDSTPLPATNDSLLNSRQKLSDTVHADHPSIKAAAVEIEKEFSPNMEVGNVTGRPSILKTNLPPVVDFPIKVASSLKEDIKKEPNKELKEEPILSSDIALRDRADENSDREGSSDETETGADISELKSFADDGASLPSANVVPLPVVEEAIPEATYAPLPDASLETSIDKRDEKDLKQEAVIKPMEITPACSVPIDHGTQTDARKENQQLSVMNLHTTYKIDKKEQNVHLNIKDIEDKVNEIVLDATLPKDTQLLVKEAQTGSSVRGNIEIDGSEIGDEPCVITSQVSLAFVGMEKNEHEEPLMLIVPEKRSKDSRFEEKAVKEKEFKTVGLDAYTSPHERSSDGSTTMEDSIKVKTPILEKEKENIKTLVSPQKKDIEENLSSSVMNQNNEDANKSTCSQPDSLPPDFHKTMSLESVELTPELLRGNNSSGFNRDVKEIERPLGPVPPLVCDEILDRAVESNKQVSLSPASPQIVIESDTGSIQNPAVNSFLRTIVSQSIEEALDQISSLSPNEVNEMKNQKFEPFNSQYEMGQSDKKVEFLEQSTNVYCSPNENIDKQNQYDSFEKNCTFPSISPTTLDSIKSTEQPREVGGNGEVECRGEKSLIYSATVQSSSTVSPLGSQQLRSDPPFRSEDTKLSDSLTPIESNTHLVQGPSLVPDDSCKREENASQQARPIPLESIRNQEAATKASGAGADDLELAHKG